MKKQFTAESLRHIRYLAWPVADPSGHRIAYVLTTARESDGSFPAELRIYDRQTGTDTRLPGAGSRRQPQWLDDMTLLYLSDADGTDQVYLQRLDDGEGRRITTLRHGVKRYTLSPDGRQLAFEATLWPEEVEKGLAFTRMTAEEEVRWQEELDWRPYEITELTYKMDEWYGMRKGEFSHLGVAALDGSWAHLLDTGDMEAIHPVWNHQGDALVFYGYPDKGPRGRMAQLFTCRPEGGDLRRLTRDGILATDAPPLFTADDRRIIYCAYPDLPEGETSLLPHAASLAGGDSTLLMSPEDEGVCHGVDPVIASRSAMGDWPSRYYLSRDGRSLYFLSAWQGRSRICRLPLQPEGPAQLVLEGDTDIQGFSLDAEDEPLCVMGSFQSPGELWQRGHTLTQHNAWLQDYELPRVESRWLTSRDGATPLQYFLVHPIGRPEGQLCPAVLEIKGGPTTMYAAAYWHEFHALAAQGFAVICGNPRGGMGFGRKFSTKPWSPAAMEDLLDMVEDALSLGFIDRKRLGVTGGSYGGYMTNKLIGRTDYFRAAVTQRCLVNPAVSYGTGDMGFINYGAVPRDFSMLDYLVDRARGNPITYIDRIRIPVLILHGYRDYRCGFEQAEQLFIAMKDRHPEVPVRLVMFPEENHAITRTGKLHSQIRHLSELVDWLCRYVKEGGEADA